MWCDLLKQSLLMSLLAGILSGASLPAQAGAIQDGGKFFSEKAVAEAETVLKDLHSRTGHEVRIETFAAVPSGRVDEVAKMKEGDRTRFFDQWARDRATTEKIHGVFILVTREPGHVEIVVDRHTFNDGFGAPQRNEVRDILLSAFRKKNFDGGLEQAVAKLNQLVPAKSPAHAKSKSPEHAHAPARHSEGIGLIGWIIIIGIAFFAIRIILSLFGGHSTGGSVGYGGGYGAPGYGGGGFFSSLMTGMLGAVAGNWLYHNFFGGSQAFGGTGDLGSGADDSIGDSNQGDGEDFQSSGGDFDSGDDDVADAGGDDGGGFFGGSDGGDVGGGDFGGGFGGGDFGGGDFGGGGDF